MCNRSTALMGSAAIVLLLAACSGGGGGGNSSSSTPAPEPAPVPEPAPQLLRIAGTISASDSQAVDGDTNDTAREAISNDTPGSAQSIPNPITLGGYINQPGTGAPGRSRAAGDIDDFYRMELLAGQSITMLVADFELADADLYLYDTQGNVVDFSIDTGEVESLVVPRDGAYLVNAFAFSGATNYILAIGTQDTIAASGTRHHPFVPWQTVVKFRDSDEANKTTTSPEVMARRLGMEQRAGGRGRARLMALRQGLSGAAVTTARLGLAASKQEHIKKPELRARWETLLAIKALRSDPRVAYAEPNYQLRALGVPDDTDYPLQWHYPMISLPGAWDTSTGDPTVIVAVVDTGILSDHPDLAGQLTPGYDFVRDPASAGDGDGIDADPEDPGNTADVRASSFHGTHVTGTIAARGNNGLGVAGAAYSSRVMPVRALGVSGYGTSYDVDQAIRFAAGLPNDSGTLPVEPADIINLSLGGAPFSQSSQDLYNQVRAAGIMLVAAAGNEATARPVYPASYAGVISVSAVNAQRRLTAYSNSGAQIDIAAPGGNNSEDLNGDGYPDGIFSTWGSLSQSGIRFSYFFLSGTSMAAPHVSAVLALMKSVNQALTPADIDALLEQGALTDDLGSPGRDDQYGHGLVNAQSAVLAAVEASGQPPALNPRLVASAGTLNFAGSNDRLELFLDNAGGGELALLQLTPSQAWLQIIAVEVDDAGLGLYRVAVDRSGLPSGVYAADIIAQSTVNDLKIRVLMSIGDSGATADVGIVYILLYDTTTDEPIAQFVAAPERGKYAFEFNDIAPGQYQIIAGPDADNDLFICDAGEACGAWLTVDQPIRFDLDASIDDVDFPIEFLVSIPSISGNAALQNTRGPQGSRPGAARGIAKMHASKHD